MKDDEIMNAIRDLKEYEREAIFMFAFRYALGRMSMAPSLMVDVISRCKGVLSESMIKSIISEIEMADKQDLIGAECDRNIWLNLAKELRHECVKKYG